MGSMIGPFINHFLALDPAYVASCWFELTFFSSVEL